MSNLVSNLVSNFDVAAIDLEFGAVVEVTFAKAFRRHVDCPDLVVPGDTVSEVLEAYFAAHPSVRSYVLDDAGAVRRHVAVFHNDDMIVDRSQLSDAIVDGDRLQIFQALSGG